MHQAPESGASSRKHQAEKLTVRLQGQVQACILQAGPPCAEEGAGAAGLQGRGLSTSLSSEDPCCDWELSSALWYLLSGLPTEICFQSSLSDLFYSCFLDLQIYKVQRHAPDRLLPSGSFLCLCTRGK